MLITKTLTSATLVLSMEYGVSIDETTNRVAPLLPYTIGFNSSNGSRAIQLSIDNGITYWTPTYDVTATSQLVLSVYSPVTTVKFTGQSGDTVFIKSV